MAPWQMGEGPARERDLSVVSGSCCGSQDRDFRLVWSHGPHCYQTPPYPVGNLFVILHWPLWELPEREKGTWGPRVLEGKVKVFESDQLEFKS